MLNRKPQMPSSAVFCDQILTQIAPSSPQKTFTRTSIEHMCAGLCVCVCVYYGRSL